MTQEQREKTARRRKREKAWLKRHGFNSLEGLMGALMREEVILIGWMPRKELIKLRKKGDKYKPPIIVSSP